jgi:phytoene desaturase
LVQLFNRYATYNGSDPFQAPATLNIIPYVENELGGYYIQGGMYRLVEALEIIAKHLGVEIYTSTRVEKIKQLNGKITGLMVRGEFIPADYVLSGADIVETFNALLDNFTDQREKLNRLEPSLSGMIFLWGINCTYPALAHHNIIFSNDYQLEFSQIFNENAAPDDPTIYIAISSKSDSSHAPNGSENWFVLLNMPYLNHKQDWENEKKRMREIVLKKLQNNNLDISGDIVHEKCITPLDFHSIYAGNRGSIYGLSSNSRLTAFRRPANRSRLIQGLYFAGGSTHPGGGIPLVLLSGKISADLIAEKEGILLHDSTRLTEYLHEHIRRIEGIRN